MLFFLGLCFFLLTLHICDLKADQHPSFPYVAGVIFLDLAILAMMVCMWAVENGKL
jgi:hypothetical protein